MLVFIMLLLRKFTQILQILNKVIQINQGNIVKTMYTKSLINFLGTF